MSLKPLPINDKCKCGGQLFHWITEPFAHCDKCGIQMEYYKPFTKRNHNV